MNSFKDAASEIENFIDLILEYKSRGFHCVLITLSSTENYGITLDGFSKESIKSKGTFFSTDKMWNVYPKDTSEYTEIKICPEIMINIFSIASIVPYRSEFIN